MLYVPLSQRNKPEPENVDVPVSASKTKVYTPIAQRKVEEKRFADPKKVTTNIPSNLSFTPDTTPPQTSVTEILSDPFKKKQIQEGASNLTREVVQGTARGLANLFQLGKSTLQTKFGTEGKISSEVPAAPTTFDKILYGKDEPFSFTSETDPLVEAVGVNPKSKTGKIFSPVLGFALAASDIIPGGSAGKKFLVKALAETDDVVEASRLLKTAGFTDDIVKDYGKIFAKSTDLNEIDHALESAAKLQNTTRPKRVYTPMAERATETARTVEETPAIPATARATDNVARETIEAPTQTLDIPTETKIAKSEPSIPRSPELEEAEARVALYDQQYENGIEKFDRLIKYQEGGSKNRFSEGLPEIGNKSGLSANGTRLATNSKALEFQKRGDTFIDEIMDGNKGADARDEANAFLDNFKKIKDARIQARRDLNLLKKNETALEKFLNRSAKQVDNLRYKNEIAQLQVERAQIMARIRAREKTIASLPSQKTTTGAQTRRVINQTLQPGAKRVVTDETSLLKKRIKDEARGAKFAAKDIKAEVRRRRDLITSIRDHFVLTDKQISNALHGKDYRFMKESEFQDFLKEVDGRATQEAALSDAKIQVKGTVHEKELRRVENLQKALKLPTVENMSIGQLNKFDELLQDFQEGDEFLSPRKLEMIERTDLAGVKTLREARVALAKKLGVKPEELEAVKVLEGDRFRWDTSLAERNPFYKVMVEGFNSAILEGDARFLEMQKKVDELMKYARKGKGIGNAFVPQDKKIFEYLESTNKAEAAKDMTKAELEAAEYMRAEFKKALDYEYEMKILGKSSYEDNYITHIRRGFFESVKEDGLIAGFKELLDKYKQDQAVLNILDQKTGDVLPLEKFFQFAMRRSGELKPTQNVSRAFLTYMKTFERKRALDKIIPEIMTYTDVLTPRAMTPKGLVMDDSLKNFVSEYLNTKKGRVSTLFVKPGGKSDFVLRSIKGLVTMLDLAINIPLQLSSNLGVHTGLYTVMGAKRYAQGAKRYATKEGREFVKQFENYTGKTPFDELAETSKGLPDKLYETMFFLFKDAVTRGNKIHLLGSLTDAEWASKKLSNARLAEMKTEAGRWLPVEGAKSILGSTTEGGLATQYKTWALPPLRTATKNFLEIAKMLSSKKNPMGTREFKELFRVAQVGATVSLIAYAVGNDQQKPQNQQTFTEKLINKTLRDALSMVSAIDPNTYTTAPRTLTFMTDIATALGDLVRLTEYKEGGETFDKGDLKGVEKLQKTFTPALIKNQKKDTPPKKTKESVSETLGFPKLPDLPDLPKLPKLPSV